MILSNNNNSLGNLDNMGKSSKPNVKDNANNNIKELPLETITEKISCQEESRALWNISLEKKVSSHQLINLDRNIKLQEKFR